MADLPESDVVKDRESLITTTFIVEEAIGQPSIMIDACPEKMMALIMHRHNMTVDNAC
jgi:hypothetical protein